MSTLSVAIVPQQEALKRLFISILQRDTVSSLTFTDPWGTAVAVEAKKKETRSWAAPRPYWGRPLAIHVASTVPPQARAVCGEAPFREVLEKAGYCKDQHQRFILPLKQVIAVAWLEHVERIDSRYSVDPQERSFGNYQLGRFAWNFGAVYRLKEPIQATGCLGVWVWTPPETFWTEIQGELDQLREGENS